MSARGRRPLRGRLPAGRRDSLSGRALVAYGDVNSMRVWGGHPYFFLQAGRRNGLFQAGVALHPERFRNGACSGMPCGRLSSTGPGVSVLAAAT